MIEELNVKEKSKFLEGLLKTNIPHIETRTFCTETNRCSIDIIDRDTAKKMQDIFNELDILHPEEREHTSRIFVKQSIDIDEKGMSIEISQKIPDKKIVRQTVGPSTYIESSNKCRIKEIHTHTAWIPGPEVHIDCDDTDIESMRNVVKLIKDANLFQRNLLGIDQKYNKYIKIIC